MTNSDDVLKRILVENRRRERRLCAHACRSHRGQRKHPSREETQDKANVRPVFAHDADRIVHSKAFARYVDKTQVFYLFENDHITHRVLHVQFVSKIGRTIGRALQLNEDLIEAIALGHDLGHVPYGHDGERVLNDLCQKHGIGGFAHNVQSVRWLMELEQKGEGWNLSLQVLDGILAHNGEMLSPEYVPQYGKTWDQFEQEYDACMRDGSYSKKILPMTLEGCVVRISDVVAYIGRDVEDAITIGLIDRADLPEVATRVLGDANRTIIHRLVMDLIGSSYGKDRLEFSAEVFAALDALMKFNYERIYWNSKVRSEGPKIKHMFEHLFSEYLKDLKKHSQGSAICKDFLRDMDEAYVTQTPRPRIAADFIAGMTDDFLNNQYKERFVPRNLGYRINGNCAID